MCKLFTNPVSVADFCAEAALLKLTSFVGNMFALECICWISITYSCHALNSYHARATSVLTAHKCTRQCDTAQHFLSMHSAANKRPVVILDYVQVVSQNLQLLKPDLDIEPVDIVLLHLQCRIVFEEDEPCCVLHVVV